MNEEMGRAIQSRRAGLAFGLAIAFAVCLTGCGDKAAGGAASGEAAGSGAPAAAKGKGVTLKESDVKAAYKSEFDDQSKMNDPMDKKTAAFVAKIGKPEKEEGGKKIWHSVDGAECHKIELSANGMMGDETVDKPECGL